MAVEMLETGPLGVCTYIVSADGDVTADSVPCVVIDPGGDADEISATVTRLGQKVAAVFLTHAHGDHIGGVRDILAAWPGSVLCCSEETSRRAQDAKANLSYLMGTPVTTPAAGRVLRDGEEFEMAGLRWRAVEIPGHEPGEMVYILGDGHIVFTGDTVFYGSVGRSDFPGGDHNALVAGVTTLLQSLPADATLYPGHGPSTRADFELRSNPFLR
ncbi:MAG: MBL fold metallo-hydrolase [Planctomycetaceae bacterium]|nr:MBL fold metallo-hydrolase [Planctomycetaceae bacterium]